MNWVHEFREFAMRGNVVDLAVGVVVGGAFGRITTSLVNDILMPPLGMVLGRMDFKSLAIPLGTGTDGKPVLLNYGAFASAIIDFVFIAFALFVVIKAVNALRRRQDGSATSPFAPKPEVQLLTEIRDLMKERS